MNAETPDNTRPVLDEMMSPAVRIVIAAISPSVDEGQFCAKATVGDRLAVEADVFADGHEALSACVAWRAEKSGTWTRVAMGPLVNDRWRAELDLADEGTIAIRIEAWLDDFGGLVRDVQKKSEAGLPVALEIAEGRALMAEAASRCNGAIRTALAATLHALEALPESERAQLFVAAETRRLMQAADPRPFLAKSFTQRVLVERKRAAFASWYELFPRSQGAAPGVHGTFRDVIAQLPRIRDMGFDVLYMPPIHPIGRTNRKGRNNAPAAGPGDPGSVYAIGAAEGGHEAVHPELGTIEDFRALMNAAAKHGIELALDFAVQMSPDHPWLKTHDAWFSKRPDGSVRYAENPPKKYEDIVNPDFYADRGLWIVLRDVLLFWANQGVRIFRVDNPHTKPIPFWEWIIAEIKARHPDTIFLSEAFTRPKRMYHLAKVGFTQSYTYFTWRNTKQELTEYLTELTTTNVRDYFRPNFFVNTPDINPPFLQSGGRPAFLIRAALAATLSGLWGMYSGFELCEAEPLPGREEYRDSEKYELKHRDFAAAETIAHEIASLNALRKREPALQSHLGVTFYNAFNDNVLYFAKTAQGRDDRILVAVSLDPHSAQECDFEVPLWEWGLADYETVEVEDLLHGTRFSWHGKVQHLRLSPSAPYAIWRIRPRGATL